MGPHIYIIHYKQNRDRASYLHSRLSGRMSYTVIDEMDRGEFKPDDHYSFSRKMNIMAASEIIDVLVFNIELARIDAARDQASIPRYTPRKLWAKDVLTCLTPGKLSETNLSLNIKHRIAWQKIVDSSNDHGLVLEDDAIFRDTSEDMLDELFATGAADRFDYIDVGGGSGLEIVESEAFGRDIECQNVCEVRTRSTRTTCAYIVKKSLARKLLEMKMPILFPIDFQLTYMFSLLRPRVAWTRETPFIHGSERGYYSISNLR